MFSREELVGLLMSRRGGACSTGRRSDLRGQDLQGVGCRQNGLLAMSRVSAVGRHGGVPASVERLVADVGKNYPLVTVQCSQCH